MSQTAAVFEAQIVMPVRMRYLLHLPSAHGQDPDQRWPLILSLHGAGERGDDLDLLKRHGIPKLVDSRPDFPFVALSPQCPADCTWTSQVDLLLALLDGVVAELAVDPDRVYLTGFSLGGYGTWHLATLHPRRFAAIAPICGGGDWIYGYPERVCALKGLPVWAFHGARDPLVPLSESSKMVEALQACGGNVRFTIYPDAEHDSWTRTYDDPTLYTWFLSHRRPRNRASHER